MEKQPLMKLLVVVAVDKESWRTTNCILTMCHVILNRNYWADLSFSFCFKTSLVKFKETSLGGSGVKQIRKGKV